MNGAMRVECDVAIIGGAFSGSSLALLLRRAHPGLRVLVIERSEKFDRKVGEASTEIAGHFLHRRLAMASYLANHQIAKQGLRFWFADGPGTPFDDCAEIGADYQVRMPAYQLDRAQLDEHLIKSAAAEGVEVWRPAKVAKIEMATDGGRAPVVEAVVDGGTREVHARWVVDASGRAATLARQMGTFRPLDEHPVNAIWGRFRGVEDLDGHTLRSRHRKFGASCIASRAAATNHLTGYGWWCWIIPLKGGDVSAGVVYDSRLYTPPGGECLGDRLKAHLLTHPVGRELFANAVPVENDVRAYSSLPYFSNQLAGPGWQLVGDAAGFLDPLYSPGLDYCSWTARCALGRISRELAGERVDLDVLNARFVRSYQTWFRALYKDKYYYIGDAELMSAAYWMDIALFYMGPVREIARAPEDDLDCLPFNGPVDGLAGKFMTFYNRRLSAIARRRLAAGCYGRGNTGWRELGDGFVPDARVVRQLLAGVRKWIGAEIGSLFLRPAGRGARQSSAKREPATVT